MQKKTIASFIRLVYTLRMLLKLVLPGLCLLGSACAQAPAAQNVQPAATGIQPAATGIQPAAQSIQPAAAAQPAPAAKPSSAPAPTRYASEAAIVEHLATVYRFAADGTGFRQFTRSIRVQTEAAVRQFGVVNIAFAAAQEHVEFDYVHVRRSDGSIVDTPASEAQEITSEVTRQAPLYSDLKEKQLPVRSLRVGDTLEYQVRIVRTTAEAPNQIWGAHSQLTDLVVLDETVELRLPSATPVTVWSPTTKPLIKEENGERVYRWTSSQLDPTAGREADAKKEADKKKTLTAAEAADLRYGKFPSIAWTTFKSWDAVGAWYRSLEADRTVADADIKAKVAELTAGKSSREEMLRAIYSYVATSIRYIGVDLGIGRYQPHLAGEVLRNQYGDCKDKHTLLAAMLIQAGFEPSPVLVGVGIRFNPDVPSPASFNHVITQLPPDKQDVKSDGKPIWLDSTQEVAPYRALLSVIRDKEVLVVPPTGLARIDKTPVALPYPSVDRFEATATLSPEGTAESHIVITSRGDGEIAFRTLVHQISPGQYDDFVQRISQAMGFGGTASHAEISRPESTDEPVRIAYDYKREKAGDWDNLRIVPQLPVLFMPTVDEKDPPKIPIQLGELRSESVATTMKLPDGWGATLPADIHVKTPFAVFDKTYRLEKGVLHADRKFAILKPELPAAEWKTYKKFTDDISLNNENWVQLSTVVTTTSAPDPLPTIPFEDPTGLMKKAFTELRERKIEAALADLDSLKAKNDKQAGLWAAYGMVSALQGKAAEALAYEQKELTVHPEELPLYLGVAQAEIQFGKRKEAEATLRDRLSRGADDPASIFLGDLLFDDGDLSAATAVIEAANAAHPDTPAIQVLLGKARLQAGKAAEGTATLKAVAEISEDPDVLNNAAYELAEANADLDVAGRAAQKALDNLAARDVELNVDLEAATAPSALGRSRMVVATWDTLGWVLFRQHKLDEAEAYIRAAWLQGQNAVVGLHLGQIEEARGNLNAAITTYSLASGVSSEKDPGAAAGVPSPVGKEIVARMVALSSKGAKIGAPDPGSTDPATSVQQLRTIPLGRAKGTYGTREFALILSNAGVAAAKGADAKSPLKNDDAILKRLDTKPWWPEHSTIRILRKGILNCHSDKCEFVYIPL